MKNRDGASIGSQEELMDNRECAETKKETEYSDINESKNISDYDTRVTSSSSGINYGSKNLKNKRKVFAF